jgi:hypothetical protein
VSGLFHHIAIRGATVIRLLRPRRRLPLLLGVLATALLFAAGAIASTAGSAIEGVWTFNGGQIALQRLSNGTYEGIVVSETKFASCSHPIGQHIWTNMTEQKDGSFWGLHQWYLSDCKENGTLGPTAWRVLGGSGGSHYLRVCFSHPGTSQPTIAADGDPKQESEYAAYHVTYGCTNSALIAPLPVAPGSGKSGGSDSEGGGVSPSVESLSLPSAKLCLKKAARFKISLRDPQYDPFKTVTILYKGHKVATRRSGHEILATIKLTHLRKGTFAITVHATTVLGHKLFSRRTYHICSGHKKRHKHKKG